MAATGNPTRSRSSACPRRGGKSSLTLLSATSLSGGKPALELAVQRAVPGADLPARATLLRWARAALDRDASVTLRFVGTAEGRALNNTYRGRDYATNVLTFVYDSGAPLAGDVVVCMPVARREARAQRKPLRAHLAHLVVHGMLHLQGHDHERDADAAAMEARETAILRRLRYADPYAPA